MLNHCYSHGSGNKVWELASRTVLMVLHKTAAFSTEQCTSPLFFYWFEVSHSNCSQTSPDAAMLFAPKGCTHPPPPITPFLLKHLQRTLPEVTSWSWKSNDAERHYGPKRLMCSKKLKNFLRKSKRDLVMACHTPPLKKAKKQAITHSQFHKIHFINGMGWVMVFPLFAFRGGVWRPSLNLLVQILGCVQVANLPCRKLVILGESRGGAHLRWVMWQHYKVWTIRALLALVSTLLELRALAQQWTGSWKCWRSYVGPPPPPICVCVCVGVCDQPGW